jgi:Putative addiction module component
LAEQLLSSLDTLSEVEIERLWFQEAARRADEMNQGLARRIPAEIVPEPDGFYKPVRNVFATLH